MRKSDMKISRGIGNDVLTKTQYQAEAKHWFDANETLSRKAANDAAIGRGVDSVFSSKTLGNIFMFLTFFFHFFGLIIESIVKFFVEFGEGYREGVQEAKLERVKEIEEAIALNEKMENNKKREKEIERYNKINDYFSDFYNKK
jgi:hypothetical protein